MKSACRSPAGSFEIGGQRFERAFRPGVGDRGPLFPAGVPDGAPFAAAGCVDGLRAVGAAPRGGLTNFPARGGNEVSMRVAGLGRAAAAHSFF